MGMGTAPETIIDLFLKGVRAFSSPNLLNYKARDGQWAFISALESAQRVRSIALGLYSLGIRPKDRIALLSENRPEWILSDLGILSVGGITVPIYTTQSLPQIEFIFSNAEPKGVVVSSRALYERILPLLIKLGLVQKVIVMERGASSSDILTLEYVEKLGEIMDKERPFLYDELCSRIRSGDLATIIYTTEETGAPKGVMLTHGNIVSNVLASSSLFVFSPKEDVSLSYLPLSHIFERATMYHYLYSQIPVYFAESVDRMPDYLMQVRPTIMTTVPRFLEKAEERMIARAKKMPFLGKVLLKMTMAVSRHYNPEKRMPLPYRLMFWISNLLVYPKWRARFGGRFRFMICGGAKLNPEISRMFTAMGIPLLQGYGLTETSPVIAVNRLEKNRLGSVGCLLPGVEVKIAQDGEIWVKGPNVTRGYYRNDQATEKAFEDSWFKTGDIGHLDSDGFLYVTDRKKDLFKTSGGKFIAPQAIESLLCASPFVHMAAVIGEGRKFASALIFPDFNALREYAEKNKVAVKNEHDLIKHPTIKQLYEKIVDEINKKLAHWETIKKFLIIPEKPQSTADAMTESTKTKRKRLEQKYRSMIESLYLSDKRNVAVD